MSGTCDHSLHISEQLNCTIVLSHNICDLQYIYMLHFTKLLQSRHMKTSHGSIFHTCVLCCVQLLMRPWSGWNTCSMKTHFRHNKPWFHVTLLHKCAWNGSIQVISPFSLIKLRNINLKTCLSECYTFIHITLNNIS